MIIVQLYGALGKKYGKTHRYSVKDTREVLRALEANYPGFCKDIKTNGQYRVHVDNKCVTEDDLLKIANKSIKIAPVVSGAGKGGIGSIILGAALLGLVWMNPMGFGMIANSEAGLLAGEIALSAMKSIGVSLLLGGVSQMLTKTPNNKSGADRPDQNPSYVFDGPVNTTAQGNPVPLAYGRVLAGSQVISAGLEVK